MTTVQLTRFPVAEEDIAALLAARPGMLAAFRADRQEGGNLPGIQAFFAVIDELVSSEERTFEDGEGQ